MSFRFLLPFPITLFFFLPAFSQIDTTFCVLRDLDGRYREHNVDFKHLLLDVSFSPEKGIVYGLAAYTFQPIQPKVDTLFLNAPGIEIHEVTLQKKRVRFETNDAGLIIRFNSTLNWKNTYQLDIRYTAKPKKGLYFIGWDIDKKGLDYDENHIRNQIWTQGQGIDNRHWIPSYDDVNDRLITELRITFDSTFTVVSNGKLKSCKPSGKGEKVWHYAMPKPHVPYLIMLAIDKYRWKDIPSKSGIISRQYYYPERPETFEPTYRYSREMMDWFPTETGVEYPWETYANVPVQEFMYGAMENTTATIFTDFYVKNDRQALDRDYIATNAHELAHQWFGDYITEWSGTHHWLHESFATYYAKLFIKHIKGEEEYDWIRRSEALSAIQADNTDHFPVAHSKAGSARHYPKGSFVLDMLRFVTGDDIFKKTITNYLRKHALGNVDTQDFWRAFMETAGINLDWFFEQWIYHAGVPHFQVNLLREMDSFRLVVSQSKYQHLQNKGYQMPVWIELHHINGEITKKQILTRGISDTFLIKPICQDSILYWLFDPGYRILKTIETNKTLSQWREQSVRAENVNDRWDAVKAMRDSPYVDKINHLIRLSNIEKNHNVLEEIFRQLAKDSSSATAIVFHKALSRLIRE